MELVLLTALGVGGATVVGVAIGFLFKGITHKFSDIVSCKITSPVTFPSLALTEEMNMKIQNIRNMTIDFPLLFMINTPIFLIDI